MQNGGKWEGAGGLRDGGGALGGRGVCVCGGGDRPIAASLKQTLFQMG